jgi:hypothetical protein
MGTPRSRELTDAYPVVMRRWVRVLKGVAEVGAVIALMLVADAIQDLSSTKRPRPPLTRLPASLDLDLYRSVMLKDGGQVAGRLLDDGLDWKERWGGWIAFGKGPYAPMYLVIPDSADKPVKALCFHTTEGDIGVLYRYPKNHPPFDEESERRDLTLRLNRIRGISIPPGRWNRRAYYVKPDVLRSPAARDAFFEIFDDVARRIQTPPT